MGVDVGGDGGGADPSDAAKDVDAEEEGGGGGGGAGLSDVVIGASEAFGVEVALLTG